MSSESRISVFDVMLGGAALIAKPHHTVWLHGQVGYFSLNSSQLYDFV